MMKIYDMVVQALLGAILLVVQVALAPLPNIELVSILILVYTLTFGLKALASIYVFVIIEGLIYGFGIWWIHYLYIWTILWAAVMLLKPMGSWIFWTLLLGIYGFCFGALCAIPYLFVGGPGAALAYWISGIPYDIFHCLGNVVAGAVLFKPLMFCMGKLNQIQRKSRTF